MSRPTTPIGQKMAETTDRPAAGRTPVEPLVYRIDDACRRLAIGRTSLYELIKSKELHPIKIAGRTVITAEELHDLVARAQAAVFDAAPK